MLHFISTYIHEIGKKTSTTVQEFLFKISKKLNGKNIFNSQFLNQLLDISGNPMCGRDPKFFFFFL